MLTEEQLNNLKEGDKLLAEVQFHSFSPYGNLMCLAPLTISQGNVIKTSNYYHPSCLSLLPAPPKHDPCRKLKKGDKARVVERYGRTPDCFPPGKIKVGDIVSIAEDESYNLFIYVFVEGKEMMGVPWFFLELVSPVEERVSFRVGDFPANGEWSVWKDSLGKTEIISSYKIDTHPNAKKAAEAERDRLNAEHRKEQNND